MTFWYFAQISARFFCLWVGFWAFSLNAGVAMHEGSIGRDGIDSSGPQERIKVVSSHLILADWVGALLGEHVQVHCLVPAHLDPHHFEPRPGDLKALQKADLVLFNGLGLEMSWLDALLKELPASVSVWSTERAIPPQQRIRSRDGSEDPHVWMDLGLSIQAIEALAAYLKSRFPQLEPVIEGRAKAYIHELNALHMQAKEAFSAIAEKERNLFTYHHSMAYFARAYQIRYIGSALGSMQSQSEPSAYRFSKCVDTLKQEGVTALFLEKGMPTRLMEQLSKETGIPLVGPLYIATLDLTQHVKEPTVGSDSSQTDIRVIKKAGQISSYLEMMAYNIAQILSALSQNNAAADVSFL